MCDGLAANRIHNWRPVCGAVCRCRIRRRKVQVVRVYRHSRCVACCCRASYCSDRKHPRFSMALFTGLRCRRIIRMSHHCRYVLIRVARCARDCCNTTKSAMAVIASANMVIHTLVDSGMARCTISDNGNDSRSGHSACPNVITRNMAGYAVRSSHC